MDGLPGDSEANASHDDPEFGSINGSEVTINFTTQLIGAPAETIESELATLLEGEFDSQKQMQEDLTALAQWRTTVLPGCRFLQLSGQ